MRSWLVLAAAVFLATPALAANISIDDSAAGRLQVIDGFGTCIGDSNGYAAEPWFEKAYYDDLGCSIMRMDLVPHFIAPYSDLAYYSPHFMGSQTKSPFNFEDKANPAGPDKNRVRTYTNEQDYSREFGGKKAPIAVMGPDIEKNIKLFDFKVVDRQGRMAQAGQQRSAELGGFKLYGSIWSPAPWLKVSSDHLYDQQDHFPYPVKGTPYPFIWNGNFAGGRLDVSNKPLEVFNDGTGPTSALTQFARSTAAYIKGFQDTYKVHFYAISIQNELNFEEFYNSATYPLSSQYIAALKAVRAEFDRYPDLKSIQIIGPEDLLGGDGWAMWQLGGGDKVTHKNLHYLTDIAKDPVAEKAISFFCIHGYASDGATSAGADSKQWDRWTSGWTTPPAQGLPPNVKGFTAYDKKSWMTETSGEKDTWLAGNSKFPTNGAWGIAFKNQQTLTAGRESAILYWQFAETPDQATPSCLTQKNNPTMAPKYVAAKHFYKFIRPDAVAVTCHSDAPDGVTASAYVHDKNHTLTIVLVNRSPDAQPAAITLPDDFSEAGAFDTYTSSENKLWQKTSTKDQDGKLALTVPGYGVVTLYGHNQ